MLNKFLIALSFIISSIFATGQAINFDVSNGQEFEIVCTSVNSLSYAGPNGGPPMGTPNNTAYPPGVNVSVTICPEFGSSVASAIFLNQAPFEWNIPDGDIINVYDGQSTAAPLIGSYNSVTDPSGLGIQSSGFLGGNPSGCITIQLISSPTGNGGNFNSLLSCGNVWQAYETEINPTNPFPNNDTIQVCFPTTIELNGTGNFAWMPGDPGYEQTDANSMFRWIMGDGTVYEGLGLTNVTHDYGSANGFYCILQITDAEGQVLRDSLVVQHSPGVDFSPLAVSADTVCLGEEVVVNWSQDNSILTDTGTYFFGGLFGEQLFIPDWGGTPVPYQTCIDVSNFLPGATITSGAEVIDLCLSIEHSFLGDLEAQLVCPNGTAVAIFDTYVAGSGSNPGELIPGGVQPGGINLGVPGAGLTPGDPFTYCWSVGPTDFDSFEDEFNNGNWAGQTAVPPGSYKPSGDFDDFIGCPVNGEWCFLIQDNFGADDGYVFDWSIQFPDYLTADPDIYITDLIDIAWTELPTNPSSNSIVSNVPADSTLIIQPAVAGTYEYLLTVTDNFNCPYDTTITVVVGNVPEITVDDDLTIDCDEDIALSVTIDGVLPPPANCFYVLELIDTFGDGWNGGFVEVIVDGASVGTFTLDNIVDNGSDATFNIPVTHLGSIQLIYTGGAFQNENEYSLFAANGDLLFTDNSNPPFNGLSFIGETNCQGPGPTYVYNWTPTNFLDDPSIPNPNATGISASTTFIVEVYEEPFTQCLAIDSVVVGLLGELNAGPDIPGCVMSYELSAISYLNNGVWSAPPGSGVVFADPTDPNTTASTTIPGTYVLTWTDPSGNSCPQSDEIIVTFLDQINVDFTLTEPSCFGDCNGMLEASPSGGTVAADYFYEWSTALQGPGENTAMNLCAGTYSLTVTDDNGCSFLHNVAVTQPAEVVIDSVLTNREECLGFCNGEITVFSAAATQYSFDGGATFGPDNFYNQACGGNATVIIQDDNGCFKETSAFVPSPVPPVADFDAENGTASVINPQFHFINQSEGNEDNFWFFGPAGVYGTSTELDPFFTYPNEVGTYSATLLVVDSIGCTDTLTRTVDVIDEFLFFLPNSFTPNGDGINDYLEAFGGDILASDFVFQVFDRWGRVVYEATDFPFKWDGGGSRNPDYFLEAGVYVWRMQSKRASTTDKIEQHGHLTIIR